MERRRKTRCPDKANLDDQCRLVAVGDAPVLGEHIPHAGDNENPESRPATRLNARAATVVGSLPSARRAGTRAASVSRPPTQTVAANTWRNTRIVSQLTVSMDIANQP